MGKHSTATCKDCGGEFLPNKSCAAGKVEPKRRTDIKGGCADCHTCEGCH